MFDLGGAGAGKTVQVSKNEGVGVVVPPTVPTGVAGSGNLFQFLPNKFRALEEVKSEEIWYRG